MTKSPLQFAKDFARLQGQVAALPSGDGQLLLLLEFWQEMREHQSDSAYRSYFDEYLPLLMQLVEPANLADLSIAELMKVQSILTEIQNAPALAASLEFGGKLNLVTITLAKVYFYVGAVEEGLAVLTTIAPSPLTPSPLPPLPEGEGKVGQDDSRPDGEGASQAPRGFDLHNGLESTPECIALQTICARATENNHPLTATLNGILSDWQTEREEIHHDRARCLFVERDDSGRSMRGRLRTLVGKIDLFGKSARTDEITFDNVIKTPDDPFVGVAYSALAAVRKVFRTGGLKNQGSSYYHAHFSIADSAQTFTGDSIGLAFGLLAYVQLLRPEVLRLDRLLSGEVAFTGGVDIDGTLTAVNDETLGQKIERAFFSSVKYVALPEANLPAAKQHLDRLRKLYPRRNLHLIAAERLSDIIEDHNIVRSEKVCIGEFVAKKAAKYGRMTKVQVPLLVVLGYLLVCLLYPKAWVGFDWNPALLKIEDSRAIALNRAGQLLWQHDFGATLTTELCSWSVSDLDEDRANEVTFMPLARDPEPFNGWLFVFDDNGDTLFTRDCSIRRVYPTDTVPYGVPLHFEKAETYVRSYKGQNIIVTVINDNLPGRGYIRFLDRSGRQLGWYINSGGSNLQMVKDLDGDRCEDFIFFGYNNRLSCLTLFVLDPVMSRGISPPSWNKDLDLTKVETGNAKYSIFFMPSEVNRRYGHSDYQIPGPFKELVDGSFNFEVDEGQGAHNDWLPFEYRFGKDFRVTEVIPGDSFRTRVNRMIRDGLLRGITADGFVDSIRFHVMYYIDGKLVTEGELRAQGQ